MLYCFHFMPLVHSESEWPLPSMIFETSIIFVCTASFRVCKVCFLYRSYPCNILSVSFLIQFRSSGLFCLSLIVTLLPWKMLPELFQKWIHDHFVHVVKVLTLLLIDLFIVSLLICLAFRMFSFIVIVAREISFYSSNAEKHLPITRKL